MSKYGRIIFEDLNIQNMLKNHKLAKHIADASWNKLIQFTTYKAESAGCVVELVNPRGTSQLCSGCGSKVPKTLKDRIHCCPQCGLEMDRDDNAARNILARSIGRAGQARSKASGECVRLNQVKQCSLKEESTGL